jgi:hypothetical protein
MAIAIAYHLHPKANPTATTAIVFVLPTFFALEIECIKSRCHTCFPSAISSNLEIKSLNDSPNLPWQESL